MGGGRGSCLNYGALFAKAKVLTFLHSDTFLPDAWDDMILQALHGTDGDGRRANVCAFHLGIHPTEPGTSCAPGLVGAYTVLGFIRCNWCSIPYGDSALSMPAQYFHHLGGYPDQPLMEDYELVTLLRKRAQLLQERIVLLPANVSCSPRRWQSCGVCYTTLVNALCVHRYKNGVTAEELFRFYYRC